MNIAQVKSPNATPRQGNRPDIIVSHIVEGTYDGTVAWVLKSKSQVSYHFIVARDGQITQAVPLESMAWANGTSLTAGDRRHSSNSTLAIVRERGINANNYTISIGFEGFLREQNGGLDPLQLNAAVWLIGHIRSEVRNIFGTDIPVSRTRFVGHNEITPLHRPDCPGSAFPFDEIIRRLGNPQGSQSNDNQGKSQNYSRQRFSAIWPVPGFPRITDTFRPAHNGIDIARNINPAREILGADIVAAADGRVIEARYSITAGNMIVLDHGNGARTRYLHNQANLAREGQDVRQGETIARVGNTGNSSGPHLHFEILIDGRAADPLDFVAPPALTSSPVPPGGLRVRVGKLDCRDEAVKLRDRLVSLGHNDAWLAQEDNYWRVQVAGAISVRENAERLADALRLQNFDHVTVGQ